MLTDEERRKLQELGERADEAVKLVTAISLLSDREQLFPCDGDEAKQKRLMRVNRVFCKALNREVRRWKRYVGMKHYYDWKKQGQGNGDGYMVGAGESQAQGTEPGQQAQPA